MGCDALYFDSLPPKVPVIPIYFAPAPSLYECAAEVQRVSFVGYTGSEGGSPRLWNLQNLHAVPP